LWFPWRVTVTVFLLDDHEIVRRGLRELLELSGDIEVVGESGSAQEAERRIPALRPDVCVRSLILTSYDDEQALRAAVIAGAAGYVLKDIKGNDLVNAIRRVAVGEQLISAEVVARVRSSLSETAVDPRLRSLTPQERRILEHIAEGMTNRQIAEDMFLAEKTVKNYVTSILDKLGMDSRTQAAVYAATHPTRGRGGRRS
jgi:two-component system response regulator DevR